MEAAFSDRSGGASWSIEDIPFDRLARDKVGDDRQLFYMLASASFVEITSDLYTNNLVEFYRGDDEISHWLTHHWESEELQHGAALRRYVETAWPDFDWDAAYRDFYAEYSRCCVVDNFAPTRALEMAARCVVETGTATFYRALSELSPEPVLARLAANISADEVRHYKHFYHYFLRCSERERPSRLAVLRTLWRRTGEIDAEDAFLAFKHVFLASNRGTEFSRSDYDNFRNNARELAKRHYPYDMAVRMILKPLELSPPVTRMVLPPMVSATRLLFLR